MRTKKCVERIRNRTNSNQHRVARRETNRRKAKPNLFSFFLSISNEWEEEEKKREINDLIM